MTTSTTKLSSLFARERRTAAWLGRLLDVSRQTAANWISGREKCPEHRRAQIAVHMKVRASDYFDRDGWALPEGDR